MAVPADIGDAQQVETLFSIAEKELGTVEALVNNAGIAQQKLFTDITEEDWDELFRVDVKGVFLCCRRALPGMIRRQNGCIINISSMWGQVGASCEVHYSAAKAAIIGLTKALAKELAPSHISVNGVSFGVIDTDMNRCFDEEERASLAEEIPYGRFASPEVPLICPSCLHVF